MANEWAGDMGPGLRLLPVIEAADPMFLAFNHPCTYVLHVFYPLQFHLMHQGMQMELERIREKHNCGLLSSLSTD